MKPLDFSGSFELVRERDLRGEGGKWAEVGGRGRPDIEGQQEGKVDG